MLSPSTKIKFKITEGGRDSSLSILFRFGRKRTKVWTRAIRNIIILSVTKIILNQLDLSSFRVSWEDTFFPKTKTPTSKKVQGWRGRQAKWNQP